MIWEIHLSMCCFYWLINKETGLAHRIGERRQSQKKYGADRFRDAAIWP